ncbi:MAG TPA: hypothetical protein VFF78_00425, partial [Anaerolineaceae bacterium]|nr:hypothetical protein [Anaerolineaceae bacterium]
MGWNGAQQAAQMSARQPLNAFGCFSYALWPGNRVRLHFRNAEPPGVSPLNTSCLSARLAEIKALFSTLKTGIGETASVVGGSWLYHLPAYRRLFPPGYLASAQPSYEDFPYLALWGQFLDRDQKVRPNHAALFRHNLARSVSLAQAKNAFPFPLLRLEGAISEFYQYYS